MTNIQPKLLSQLRTSILYDINVKPTFIDNTIAEDNECFEVSIYITKEISRTFINRIISANHQREIMIQITRLFEDMQSISPVIAQLYFEYIDKLLKHYQGMAVDNQLFEVAENVKTLRKNYNN